MPQQRLVIIGGVAAGMSAASRARKLDPQLEIVVLEKGGTSPTAPAGFPTIFPDRWRTQVSLRATVSLPGRAHRGRRAQHHDPCLRDHAFGHPRHLR
jgi:NADPH-dependent 2,4-dienoyl-CoA reductase/sulfur reductase-like enzyme